MTGFAIRDARDSDAGAIHALLERAFGRKAEAELVDRLLSDGDAVLSLVAVEAKVVLGHVLFSRMTAPFRALGLAPVSVGPTRQREGIGAALIRAGLARAEENGEEAVFVLGDPAYYGRFGFDAAAVAGYTSPYAGPYLMAKLLRPGLPMSGQVDYAPAFAGLE
jgi:putative acetyltransferase